MRPNTLLALVLVGAGLLTLLSARAQSGRDLGLPLELGDPEGTTEICATGCALAATGAKELSEGEFLSLLSDLSSEGWSTDNSALETLLFHGPRSRALLDSLGRGPLDQETAERLEAELALTHALLVVRLVEDDGTVRVQVQPRRLLLGERTHMLADLALGVQTPEITGTIVRVGLKHLWVRL